MKRAFGTANILIPVEGTDMTKWSVVACDQYTSEPEYWKSVEEMIGDSPSCYNLILPEVYLGTKKEEEHLSGINETMDKYLSEKVLKEYPDAFVYIERIDSSGNMRAGIVGAIDLEQYDYSVGSRSLVRATEATVLERIPPRVKIRERAAIELPHIMILIDDRKKTVVEMLGEKKDELKKVYDFDLMMNGGHITGWIVDDAKIKEAVLSNLDSLAEGTDDDNVLQFAMGDGNHSLATAKAYYEKIKQANPDKDMSDHPARYALAEIVNLHSPALEFEAIHRIVENIDRADLLRAMTDELGLTTDLSEIKNGEYQKIWIVRDGNKEETYITKTLHPLAVGSLQIFLDKYIKENNAKIDYIHGEEIIVGLSKKETSIGFLLPDMGKEELFPSVRKGGVLPRKTFSMGHAADKRYYVESRLIR